MLMVQQFHSIHEIDPEFVASIELLLQEEIPNFEVMVQKHDQSPATDVFTYFLFFAPTQNTPIGIAKLCLRKIPSKKYLPWYRKLKFWDKEHEHWKQLTWKLEDGYHGPCVFDSRFSRTGKEKIQELIKNYENRNDIVAENIFTIKDVQDFKSTQESNSFYSQDHYILGPLCKTHKSYQEYLASLKPNIQKQIKGLWKELNQNKEIKLGDYPQISEIPDTLIFDEKQFQLWQLWRGQILTFEKNKTIIGHILVIKGKNGNFFFEPFPLESENNSIISDELYIQYALLKFFEMPEAKKCHLMKFNSKITFDKKDDCISFEEQGFPIIPIIENFHSRLDRLNHPL